ncbi:MAG: hypothetical protein KatS3mg110_0379 [Pirellulaceae bacterium]|nr:MAG: hypothetical protein KatS3mg110_0379 [Pirellulaceae bacterium]
MDGPQQGTNGEKPGGRPGSLAIVAAVADNGVIGKQGRLPWHLPEDLRHFKKLTMGHVLIMGRRTYESIGRPLPGRRTIVLSSSRTFQAPGILVAGTFQEALRLAQDSPLAFVVGGAAVYREALRHADQLYLTRIYATVDGDTFFPEIDWQEWQWVERIAEAPAGKYAFSWSIDRYKRRRQKESE